MVHDYSAAIQAVEQLKPSLWGRFVYRFLPYRLGVIKANIEQVFQTHLTASQKKRLAQAFYGHLLTSMREMIALRFMSEAKLKARVEVRGAERLMKIAEKGQGVLILTGHLGNWEFAPLGGIMNFKAFQGQFHFIRRTLGSKRLEQILFRRYFKAGLNVIPKTKALDKVCDALETGHAVVFVLDQHASLANKDGVAVEFFGKKAGTYRSLATISRYTQIPVVPAAGFRLPNGRHVLEFGEPIAWQDCNSTKEAIYTNTLAYNQALEKLILAHPEQWLWLHKRWKI